MGFGEKPEDKRSEKVKEKLESYCEAFIEPLMRFIKEGLDEKEKKGALYEIQSKTELNLIKQHCTIMEVLMEECK